MEALKRKIRVLRCPSCCHEDIVLRQSFLQCRNCKEEFSILSENSAVLLSNKNFSLTKKNIQEFWGDTCKQWYSVVDESLTQESLNKHVEDLLQMFIYRKHLAVTEMELKNVTGLSILEVGSGGGGHSALFQKQGADVVAVDITPERVKSTAKKLSLLKSNSGVAFVGDAENLPFIDNSFDIVYSNGVLHHSENTDKCLDEVFRVLKPEGKAIIMVYCRSSAHYWLNLFIRSILSGAIFRFPESERLGRITEGKPKFGKTKNPITRIYSKKKIYQLFNKFKILSLRKNSFMFDQLPLITRLKLRTLFIRLLGYKPHSGGIIVYGRPFLAESKLELYLSPYIGFCWNIVAIKE